MLFLQTELVKGKCKVYDITVTEVWQKLRLVLLLPLVRYSTYFEPVGGIPDLLFTVTTWRQLGRWLCTFGAC